jgi:hypothetical protein
MQWVRVKNWFPKHHISVLLYYFDSNKGDYYITEAYVDQKEIHWKKTSSEEIIPYENCVCWTLLPEMPERFKKKPTKVYLNEKE